MKRETVSGREEREEGRERWKTGKRCFLKKNRRCYLAFL
jgi:hypothetical protein